jgi:hypothetical protein
MRTILGLARMLTVIVALLLPFSGCKKAKEDATQDILQQYFDTNILNRDFKVKLATNLGTDLTPNYEGYVFKLLKTTNYDGQMTAIRNDSTYLGNWSTNDDFSKLTINLPSTPQPFVFLNRSWRFTKKALPVMELAPWGTNDSIVLHMERL